MSENQTFFSGSIEMDHWFKMGSKKEAGIYGNTGASIVMHAFRKQKNTHQTYTSIRRIKISVPHY